MDAEHILLLTTAGLYLLLSVVLGITALGGKEELKRKLAHGIWLGVAAHTALLIMVAARAGRFPAASTFETLILSSWILAAAYAGMQTALRRYSLGMFVAPIVALALCAAFFTTDTAGGLATAAQKSRWLYIHISLGLASFAFFTLAFVAAVGYFMQEYFLKTRRKPQHLNLPPLEWLDNTSYRLISMGFPLLTIAIVIGAVCLRAVYKVWWMWEPKLTALIVLWVVYAVYLQIRAIRGWRGRGTNVVLICGFVVMILSFLGVIRFR